MNDLPAKKKPREKVSLKTVISDSESMKRINPIRESSLIVFWYSIFGFLWITTTDTILDWLVSDQDVYYQIQLAKGWIFVFLTMIIIFLIVKKRISFIKEIAEEMVRTTHVLTSTKEKLNSQEAITEKILESAPILIAIWDNHGNLETLNPYALEVLGFQEPGFQLSSWKDLFSSEKNLEKAMEIFEILKTGTRFLNFENSLIDKNGETRYILWNSGPLPETVPGVKKYISFGSDVTDKKKSENQLLEYAYTDALTSLPNRFSLEKKIAHRFLNPEKQFALLYIDIDNFKYVNDSLGHTVGDELLKYIAKCIQKSIGSNDFVSRLGGDEFAILVDNYHSQSAVYEITDRIKQELGKNWYIYNHSFFISLSIGVAISGQDGNDFTSLSKNADIAMYSSKNEGKDRVMFFTHSMENNQFYHIEMAKRMQKALDENEFELYYQPQYRLADHKLVGFEALLRWNEPSKGFVSPAEFIPIAEETGQIYAIERWVFQAALKQKEKWIEQGYGNYALSINLSSKTLISDPNFANIETYLSEFKGDLSYVVIEITETALIKDFDKGIARVHRLEKMGVRIALDDFGTGYSSLTHLKLFPVGIVKLDRNFISKIENRGKDAVIVSSIISLVKNLGFLLVGEGIENQAQYDFLVEQKCDVGQGFLMSRPIPLDQVNSLLQESENKNKTK